MLEVCRLFHQVCKLFRELCCLVKVFSKCALVFSWLIWDRSVSHGLLRDVWLEEEMQAVFLCARVCNVEGFILFFLTTRTWVFLLHHLCTRSHLKLHVQRAALSNLSVKQEKTQSQKMSHMQTWDQRHADTSSTNISMLWAKVKPISLCVCVFADGLVLHYGRLGLKLKSFHRGLLVCQHSHMRGVKMAWVLNNEKAIHESAALSYPILHGELGRHPALLCIVWNIDKTEDGVSLASSVASAI